MYAIRPILYSAMILSWLSKVNGFSSVDTVVRDGGVQFKLIIDTMNPVNFPFETLKFNGMPCTCNHLACSCCVGLNIVALNFDRSACTTATIVPHLFALDFGVTVGDDTIMSSRLSAQNPPPMCAPLPFFPIVSACVRFSKLGVMDNRLHSCVDFEVKVAELTIAIFHFQCFALGGDGISFQTAPKPKKPFNFLESLLAITGRDNNDDDDSD